MGSSSVIRWLVFHMMTHAPLTWASDINCYFNGQVIGSRRQISLPRNVEKHHRFWGARALGSWQSIQIACRLQESVREDTGRRVLHVVRIELTARSHILVSWSIYPNYEYHYFSMHLVPLWLVEITCRLECISAHPVAKCDPWNGRATHRSDWRNSLAKVHVRIFGYQNIQFCFQYFYVGQPKIIADHPRYHLGGPLGDPGFFVSCSTGACMMWCQRVTQICDCNSNVSVPWTWRLLRHAWLQSCISWQNCHWSKHNQITSVGIYIFAKSFEMDYFANAFPYKYNTQHYQQKQVWYRNASLGRHADHCTQTEFMEDNRVVTWRCFHGNALFEIW